MLDLEYETFVVYVIFFSSVMSFSSTPLNANIHPSHRPQIAGLIVKKASIKVPTKYADFTNIFFPDLASELLKHTEINNYTIKLVNG